MEWLHASYQSYVSHDIYVCVCLGKWMIASYVEVMNANVVESELK